MRAIAAVLIPALLGAAPALAARAVEDTVLQAALVLLGERLAGPDPVQTAAIVADVGRRTRRSPEQVRAHLRSRLEGFAALPDVDPEAWRAIVDLRATATSRRQAERFLRQVVAGSRDILADDGDYLVGTSVHWAARSARIPVDEATGYVRRLVAHGIVDTTAVWVPEPKGLVVSGWTERYEYSLDPLLKFFDTQNEDYVREAVRDVQRFVVPRLVGLLPASRGVRYAVRDRDATALIDPDYSVRVVVQSLRFAGTNADLLPCLDARVELVATATAQTAWTGAVSWCTQRQGSAHVHELDPFYDEVAQQLYARLDEYFETPK